MVFEIEKMQQQRNINLICQIAPKKKKKKKSV